MCQQWKQKVEVPCSWRPLLVRCRRHSIHRPASSSFCPLWATLFGVICAGNSLVSVLETVEVLGTSLDGTGNVNPQRSFSAPACSSSAQSHDPHLLSLSLHPPTTSKFRCKLGYNWPHTYDSTDSAGAAESCSGSAWAQPKTIHLLTLFRRMTSRRMSCSRETLSNV